MLFNREPALILGFIQTALALFLAFGVELDPEQIGSILAASAALLALVTRSRVTPT